MLGFEGLRVLGFRVYRFGVRMDFGLRVGTFWC